MSERPTPQHRPWTGASSTAPEKKGHQGNHAQKGSEPETLGSSGSNPSKEFTITEVTRTNPSLKVAVMRKDGPKNEQGHQKSLATTVGRAYKHSKGVGINVTLDNTPVMKDGAYLTIFAGAKGGTFGQGAAGQLAAFEVTEYTDKAGALRKRWDRIGMAFLSKNGCAYQINLNALPSTGRITMIVPARKNAPVGEAQVEGGSDESTEELPF
jgi:hypothetical protein